MLGIDVANNDRDSATEKVQFTYTKRDTNFLVPAQFATLKIGKKAYPDNIPLPPIPGNPPPGDGPVDVNQWYYVENQEYEQRLSVEDCGPVELSSEQTPAQQWRFVPTEAEGYYTVENRACVDSYLETSDCQAGVNPGTFDPSSEPLPASFTEVKNTREFVAALEQEDPYIVLRAGTYDGQEIYRSKYATGNPVTGGQNLPENTYNFPVKHKVTIRGYPGERPVIDGSALRWQDFPKKHQVVLWRLEADGSVIENLEFKNSADRVLLVLGDNITVRNCYFHDNFAESISLAGNNFLGEFNVGVNNRDERNNGDHTDGLFKNINGKALPNRVATLRFNVSIGSPEGPDASLNDDGYDMWTGLEFDVHHNLSMKHGTPGRNFGQGFKQSSKPVSNDVINFQNEETANTKHRYYRNISYDNASHGFNNNSGGGMETYENIAWKNAQMVDGARDFNNELDERDTEDKPGFTRAPLPNDYFNNIAGTAEHLYRMKNREVTIVGQVEGNSWQRNYRADLAELGNLMEQIAQDPTNLTLFGPGAAVWQEQERLLSDMTGEPVNPSTAAEYNPDGYDVSKDSGSESGPAANLQWQLVAADEGYYFLQNRGCNKRLDADTSQVVDANNLGTNPDKRWKLIPAEPINAPSVASSAKGDPTAVNAEVVLRLYPNPTHDQATLRVSSAVAQEARVVLSRTSGQVVRQQTVRLQVGNNRVDTDVSALPPGIYLLRVQAAHGHYTPQKLIIE